MSYRGAWEIKKAQSEANQQTPVDEYYFWKNLIEDKQEGGESVPDTMFTFLGLAQNKMNDYFLRQKIKEQIELH
jgi:hypothetical protein